MTGILRQPGLFRTRFNSFIVSCRTLAGHMSIFVTTTNTGTLRASASPRCSGWVEIHVQCHSFRHTQCIVYIYMTTTPQAANGLDVKRACKHTACKLTAHAYITHIHVHVHVHNTHMHTHTSMYMYMYMCIYKLTYTCIYISY